MSGGTSSEEGPFHGFVANTFVRQYYNILKNTPEVVHKFYHDESVIDRPGPDGAMTSVTTLEGIDEKIMSTDYKGCSAEIITADAQESLEGAVLVAVTGYLTSEDNVKRSFSQTFFLAKQEKGFFVLNDIFRLKEASEPRTSNESDENRSSLLLTQDPETPDVPNHPKPISTSTCPEVIDSGEKVSNAKDTAVEVPTEVEVPNSSVSPSPKESTLTHLASNVNQDTKKTSYASMVAKESRVTSPNHNSGYKIVRVAANADQHSIALPSPRDPVTTVNSMTKELNPNNGATENNNAHGDAGTAKSVYIGNLPSSITKNGLYDAMKQFGRVRTFGIQIKKFEDGFCFGFVEFESASFARAAVEVHNINLGENEAYIMYKKSGARSRNGSVGNGGFRNGNSRGQENGEIHGNGGCQDDNQVDFGDHTRGFGGQSGETYQKVHNRDGRPRRGEAYHRNSRRSNDEWSNGESNPRNSQRREEREKNGEAYERNNQQRYERAAPEGGADKGVVAA